MNNIPVIKIDKKFKKAMQSRWDLRYAKRRSFIYTIKTTCPLCKIYYKKYCDGCPLNISLMQNCSDFVTLFNPPRALHMRVQELKWDACANKEVRIWIKQFKLKIKKYIRWV